MVVTVSSGNVLTAPQVQEVINSACPGASLIAYEERPASVGMAGFLGDHYRVTLQTTTPAGPRTIALFVKTLPVKNPVRAEFVDECRYFHREMMMFRLMDELKPAEGPNQWSINAYICTERLVVLTDLSPRGYTTRPPLAPLDAPHTLLAAAALARFHAAVANYETRRNLNRTTPLTILEEHVNVITEPTFKDSPWVRAAAKLNANFLKEFSTKYNKNTEELEHQLAKLNVLACSTLKEDKDTLNVLIHKDLWINNIMFRYEGDTPVNALLIDFQLVRYAPAAFDLMIFLYLTTTRSFRVKHEKEIFDHYFSVFWSGLDEKARVRMKRLHYDRSALFGWCERARMFGLFAAVGMAPQVLMDAATAQQTYDDPATYHRVVHVDRTDPVARHAARCHQYKDRLLELFEEYVEMYVVNQTVD